MTAVVLIYTGDGVMYFGSRPTPTPIQVQQSARLKLAISKLHRALGESVRPNETRRSLLILHLQNFVLSSSSVFEADSVYHLVKRVS